MGATLGIQFNLGAASDPADGAVRADNTENRLHRVPCGLLIPLQTTASTRCAVRRDGLAAEVALKRTGGGLLVGNGKTCGPSLRSGKQRCRWEGPKSKCRHRWPARVGFEDAASVFAKRLFRVRLRSVMSCETAYHGARLGPLGARRWKCRYRLTQ